MLKFRHRIFITPPHCDRGISISGLLQVFLSIIVNFRPVPLINQVGKEGASSNIDGAGHDPQMMRPVSIHRHYSPQCKIGRESIQSIPP